MRRASAELLLVSSATLRGPLLTRFRFGENDQCFCLSPSST